MSIGTTIATADLTAAWGNITVELPDVVSHVMTLRLRNQDNFSSEYGYRGTDYDYQLLLRNAKESQVAGSPKITRHNATFNLVKRAVVSSGVLTPAIPYQVSLTLRLPETGTQGLLTGLASNLAQIILTSDGANAKRMFNFES